MADGNTAPHGTHLRALLRLSRHSLASWPGYTTLLKNTFDTYFISDVRDEVIQSNPHMGGLIRKLGFGIPGFMKASNLLFIHVPKNAGTSIAMTLYGRKIGHTTAAYYESVDQNGFYAMPRLAVLRDPVDRAISAYRHLMLGRASEIPTHPAWLRETRHIKSFSDYVLFLSDRGDHLDHLDHPMRLQSSYVTDRKEGNIIIDNFILFEELRDYEVCLPGKGAIRLPKLNVSLMHKPDVIRDADLATIESYYQKDVALIQTVKAMGIVCEQAPNSA